jgi:hypothetical protein
MIITVSFEKSHMSKSAPRHREVLTPKIYAFFKRNILRIIKKRGIAYLVFPRRRLGKKAELPRFLKVFTIVI